MLERERRNLIFCLPISALLPSAEEPVHSSILKLLAGEAGLGKHVRKYPPPPSQILMELQGVAVSIFPFMGFCPFAERKFFRVFQLNMQFRSQFD